MISLTTLFNIFGFINIFPLNFLWKYCLYSFILEYLINLVFIILDTKINKNWYYLKVDNYLESFEILNSNINFLSRNNLNFKLTNIDDFVTKETSQNRGLKGVIVEDLKGLPKSVKSKLLYMKLRGLELIRPVDWCEKYLNNFPSEFITNEYWLEKSFFKLKMSFQLRFKRLMEFIFSLLLLFAMLPFLVISALLIKLSDGGPIFYSQIRTGYAGKSFRIWKLRSMKINAEKNGAQWSKKNDDRITKIGQLLRSTRIDEIPQLYNVIKGDMSLIGPRPERPEIDDTLKEYNPNYSLRYMIKPGLSGWAQVNYPYGASKKDSFIKLSFDLYYIKNFSILLDLIILFKTIKLVLNRKGFLPK